MVGRFDSFQVPHKKIVLFRAGDRRRRAVVGAWDHHEFEILSGLHQCVHEAVRRFRRHVGIELAHDQL
jgi:hypothetical protein